MPQETKKKERKKDKRGDGLQSTNIEGFPVAKISEQVIAPARETMRSDAAYAKSIECKNLHNFRGTSDLRRLKHKHFGKHSIISKISASLNNHKSDKISNNKLITFRARLLEQ